jgi:glycerol-3-phosphate dehydrogenase (NAD(P)+)
VALPESLVASSDLGRTLAGAELVVLALPSHAFRSTLERCRQLIDAQAIVLSATKGIENDSLMLMSEVVADVLGARASENTVVLSGPTFAREVAARLPTNVVAAGKSEALCRRVQQLLATDWLRVYTHSDPTGVEVGGALKNVIAIAAGACDGLGFGHNTRAGLITRGLFEMTRLGLAKGAEQRTLFGLSGLGDLVLTCTGELSRNRTLGFELGRGRALTEALAALGHVAEGVPTARSAYHLAERLGVELPISSEVYRVLFENKDLGQAVRDLLTRPLRTEWE